MCKKPEALAEEDSIIQEQISIDKSKQLAGPTHTLERDTSYDWLLFLGPLLFSPWTPVYPIYLVCLARFVSVHAILIAHYIFIDKDNYHNKISQKQIKREKDDYLTAYLLHMYTQIPLQLLFPSMFFSDTPMSVIPTCALITLGAHILMVEPLYYIVHRWLHTPHIMKSMHGFHHLSVQTTPTTGMVQNFHEHFVYIAVFGPAFFTSFILTGQQHWTVILAYLVSFDVINAWGHTNVRIRAKWWTQTPLKYLFYTPEFHLGHHAFFNKNYALFMPLWDYAFGTAREYQKPDRRTLPVEQQDFVFLGHNGGLGHLLTCPEFSIYNVYDDYKFTGLPIQLELLLVHGICQIYRLFFSFYSCSRYCMANEHVGRIIVLLRTPWDYMNPKYYDGINQELVQCIREQHQKHGTRYFGLGNLNKMKQLNDSGVDVAKLVAEDDYLRDKKIRVWTGDTMTVASVYHQVADIPNLDSLYYIGAGGKVGTAVIQMLLKTRPQLRIQIFSRNPAVFDHPNVTYSTNLTDMTQHRVTLVGKILSGSMYAKALSNSKGGAGKCQFMLDYTVPALPIPAVNRLPDIQHIRVGLLRSTSANNAFLKGHYDVCMSHDENMIVPCHFGCLLNTVSGRETDEVGPVDPAQVERLWSMALARGFDNVAIEYNTTKAVSTK